MNVRRITETTMIEAMDRVNTAGNWHDYNIGPPIAPMMASEQCECAENGVYHLEGYRNWVQGPEPAQSMVGKVVYHR